MSMKKHIVCFGDSNTHGYCADPKDTETHADRFSENERWTCLLQKALGDEYYVIEEGLSVRPGQHLFLPYEPRAGGSADHYAWDQ